MMLFGNVAVAAAADVDVDVDEPCGWMTMLIFISAYRQSMPQVLIRQKVT